MRNWIFVLFCWGSCYGDAFDVASRFVPSDAVIIDCGAHDGSDTYKMAKFWPQGKIYAFECRHDVYEQLRTRVAGLQNVQTFEIALGEMTGFADFFLSAKKNPRDENPFDAQSSLLPPTDQFVWSDVIEFCDVVKVPIITLDDWANMTGVKKVDFLYLDMQGAECQMLRASPRILSTVKVIYTEYSELEFYKGTVLLEEYKSWLESLGFSMICKEQTCHTHHGNVVFVRKELLK